MVRAAALCGTRDLGLNLSGGNEAKTEANSSAKAGKKTFLKKGARGWWMRQPGAKQKVVKHTLASKGEEEQSTVRRAPVTQRTQQQQQQRRRRRSSSASSSGTLSPVATPPQRTVPVPPQSVSPPVSPIQRNRYTNQDDFGHNEVDQRRQTSEEFVTWKNASFRSTSSTDIMGMKNVRQSYEARQEQEANEMAEFEAIERDLAVEKEAYLMEKQQQGPQQSNQRPLTGDHQSQIDRNQTNRWELPYSSFVSDLHDQEQSRWQTTRSGSIFDDSLDGDADSALVFDDHAVQSTNDTFTGQLRGYFGYGNHYGELPSDLSAVSFDDSVPWDDGLSFQPRESLAREQVATAGDSDSLQGLQDKRFSSLHDSKSAPTQQTEQAFNQQVRIAEHDSTGGFGFNNQCFIPENVAPVSASANHAFGECEQNEGDRGARPSNEIVLESNAGNSSNTANPTVPPMPPPTNQDRSLSTLKQKLRCKQKPSTKVRVSNTKINNIRAGPAKAAPAGPPRGSTKQKSGASTSKHAQPRNHADAGAILPAVIEEKLYELEEEVKFYKAETLQLQKRREHFEQEVKKLAVERDNFARYQQEQRVLIEKEWERERTKMKKEEKLQERQWKLRMNATISHQDRKDRGEVEALKAQIVKMQLDEKARASKWKAVNDNLRQRVTELEGKNRELSDEIKFLEKDRLEQWEKYERLLKEDASEAVSTVRTAAVASPLVHGENSELRTVNDVFTIGGAADELLQRWSLPHTEISREENEDQNYAFAVSSVHNHRMDATVEDYNPKRYSLDRDASSEPAAFADGGTEHGSETAFADDYSHGYAHGGAKTYEWVLPEDDGVVKELGHDPQKSGAGNGAISASTALLSEHKTVSQEIEHAGGKKEFIYTDRSRKIIFADGNEKNIDPSGHVLILFTNGDHKETKLTTYPDNRKVYEFPNQQVETSLPDGTTEIQFADGIKKTIRPNGDEFSVFPDGTTMLEQPDGLREVTLLNQKKIRYFPDGQMACVTPGGQETRVRSDSELKQLMEST
ncbi:unnamed protein product [Phytophthora fragariaefolia]|uniref:Unnamed protein product n=1 Tax=Phytophthora fragariaefolia TaxID=1490495 RepID=A0A9W6TPY5_9STRA|nr:unnamed protein product [Phytophthora fragariaefolia]